MSRRKALANWLSATFHGPATTIMWTGVVMIAGNFFGLFSDPILWIGVASQIVGSLPLLLSCALVAISPEFKGD